MEELDVLKKAWNKNEHFPKITEEKIYAMLHKNSSSAVKWIFIISVIEIVFWTFLSVFMSDDDYFNLLETYHIKTPIIIFTVINYIVVIYFIYKFYLNYKKINTTDSVKGLLKSILNTRKTVKHYVWYNLAMIAFVFIIMMFSQIKYDKNIQQLILNSGQNSTLTYLFITGVYLVILIILIVVFLLFYRLIYGFLIKRLKHNFDELKKIDF